MKGFQSTSFDVESAARFLSSSGAVTGSMRPERGVLLEIMATRGLHLGGGEDEFLLPHGSRFRVVGTREITLELKGRAYEYEPQTIKRQIIQVEQIDRDDYPTGRVEEEVDEDDDYDEEDDE